MPGSSSYDDLYLNNGVLLAWSGSSPKMVTAFNAQNGKQLWQQTENIRQIAIAGQSVFVEQKAQTTQTSQGQQTGQIPPGDVVNALDLHSGQRQWSLTLQLGVTLRGANAL